MLRIRLRRVGRKNDPHFQLIVIPRTNPAKGNYLAKLGWFDPRSKQLNFNEKDLLEWLNKGAKPTNTVAKLLIAKNIKHKSIVYTPNAPQKAKKKKKDAQEKKAGAVKPEIPEIKSENKPDAAVELQGDKTNNKPTNKKEEVS